VNKAHVTEKEFENLRFQIETSNENRGGKDIFLMFLLNKELYVI